VRLSPVARCASHIDMLTPAKYSLGLIENETRVDHVTQRTAVEPDLNLPMPVPKRRAIGAFGMATLERLAVRFVS
jgi:hypothetical protein